MKQKLTITIDSGLLPVAKRYARSRGMSLSAVIEQQLRDVAGEETQTFAQKWRGKFKSAEGGDARYEALAKKYLQ